MMSLTKNEFIKNYADNSGMEIDELLKYRKVSHCYCYDSLCDGWKMESKTLEMTDEEMVIILAYTGEVINGIGEDDERTEKIMICPRKSIKALRAAGCLKEQVSDVK